MDTFTRLKENFNRLSLITFIPRRVIFPITFSLAWGTLFAVFTSGSISCLLCTYHHLRRFPFPIHQSRVIWTTSSSTAHTSFVVHNFIGQSRFPPPSLLVSSFSVISVVTLPDLIVGRSFSIYSQYSPSSILLLSRYRFPDTGITSCF